MHIALCRFVHADVGKIADPVRRFDHCDATAVHADKLKQLHVSNIISISPIVRADAGNISSINIIAHDHACALSSWIGLDHTHAYT